MLHSISTESGGKFNDFMHLEVRDVVSSLLAPEAGVRDIRSLHEVKLALPPAPVDKSRVHVDEMQRTLERAGLHPISIRIVLQRPGSKRWDRQVVAECWTRAGALDEHNCTAEDYCEV